MSSATTATESETDSRTRVHDQVITLDPEGSWEYGGSWAGESIRVRLAGPAGGPIVAVLGGISADRRVAPDAEGGGWWPGVAGPGHALDPASRRILSFDWVVPSGEAPLVTPGDQAEVLAHVVRALGVGPLHGVVGASYGGAVALAFAARHPWMARGVLVLGAADRPHPMATALRVIQRRIVRRGLRAGDEAGAVALARALAVTTYRSAAEFEVRFAGEFEVREGIPRYPVESYLDHQGRRFAERFDPRRFLALSESLDLHAVDPGCIEAPLTLVAIEPDSVAPRWQVERLAQAVTAPCRLVRLDSPRGHDAFLAEPEAVSAIVAEFLERPGLDR